MSGVARNKTEDQVGSCETKGEETGVGQTHCFVNNGDGQKIRANDGENPGPCDRKDGETGTFVKPLDKPLDNTGTYGKASGENVPCEQNNGESTTADKTGIQAEESMRPNPLSDSPSGGSAKAHKQQKLLLDVLPVEVLERVSAHLSHGVQTPMLLPLAETSGKFSEAVMSTLSYTVTITPATTYEEACRWAHLVREPDCLNLEANAGPPCFGLLKRKVQRVNTVNDLFMLSAIGMYGVKELRIRFVEGGVGVNELKDCLRGLNELEGLRLECGKECKVWGCWTGRMRWGFVDGGCLMREDGFWGMIEHVCPGVKKLEVLCGCGGGNGVWEALRDGIEEFGIAGGGVGQQLEALEKMETVRFMGVSDGWSVGVELGEKLKEFWSREALNEVMVEELGKCKGLEKVGVSLKKGAERGLKEMVTGNVGLKVMKICWEGGMEAEVLGGCVLSAVEVGGMLEDVGIGSANFGTLEMLGVMKHMGKRLRGIEIAIGRNGKVEKVEQVLKGCLEWNAELRCLDLVDYCEHGRGMAGLRICGVEKVKRRVMALMGMLRRRAPFWDAGCVERFVSSLEEVEEG